MASGKGGVGKTTTAANVGVALALRGRSVVLIDANFGLRNLDVVLGLESRISYDLSHVLEGSCKIEQAMVKYDRAGELHLVAAPEGRGVPAATKIQMKRLCARLKRRFDYVIIDCPNGLESGFKLAVSPADQALLVATPEVSSVRNVDRIMRLLHSTGISTLGLVLNRIRYRMVKRGDMMAIDDIPQLLNTPLLGLVPERQEIVVAANRGIPSVFRLRSPCGLAFSAVAARMDGEDVPFAKARGLHTWTMFRRLLAPRTSPGQPFSQRLTSSKEMVKEGSSRSPRDLLSSSTPTAKVR